ncbi:MAG: precorrin-3B C(17)-methyltransferase [Cyanobacteria bacterium SBC]|nr:precorrin-3B C(17)-methyltransferase [Cyanobacteria bacterium SBC]
MTANSKIKIIAPTPNGKQLAEQLQRQLNATIWESDDRLTDALPKLWQTHDRLLFVLAVGAVVRLIAPLLQDKTRDPGVVVVDETGKFVISLSGGHLGGADELARQVAACLDVEPIITTASEGQNLPAVDLLGKPYGWQRGGGDWLGVAKAMTRNQSIAVKQTCGFREIWQGRNIEFDGEMLHPGEPPQACLWISDELPPEMTIPCAAWHPRTLWVGIGCERNTEMGLLEEALKQSLKARNLALESIAGFASLELKRDERGLLELAEKFQVPLKFYTAEELAKIPVPNPSEIVKNAVGTPSVSEAAAIDAGGDGTTLILEKRVFRDDRGACTISIARSPVEHNPNLGKLYLIGTGPGNLAQLTAAARQALSRCDAVVGYKLYTDLLQPLFHPNQQILEGQMTKEVERAQQAIELAKRGLTVAVVSSGDCGIYGMAGLVLECLAKGGWDGKNPDVEVFPGITALQAIAARVGAPLMHDFCAISLSDLLTPWDVIVKRLEAAAAADFVVALYNPKSQKRTEQIQTALAIFQNHRSPETPVAVARSLYRENEKIEVTTLDRVDVGSIDMLTTVLIGNRSTFVHENYAITPRGYVVS